MNDVAKNKPDDATLVASCLQGDQRAFEVLIERHQRPLFGVIMRVVNHQQDAADLSQQALLKAWQGLKGLKEHAAFKGWLIRIGVNLARNHVSRYAKRYTTLPDLDRIPDTETAEHRILLAEKRKLLTAAMNHLPPRQQEVVSMRLEGGLSFREIANATGTKEASTRVNFHHGLRKLKEIIASKGGLN